jgi:hypothetical protein
VADNVTIDPGTTPSVAVSTDDAGAAGHVQRVKLAYSADGVATHATVDADGVLVNLGANNDVTVTSGTVTVTGVSTAAKQPALGTAGTPSADVITVQGVTSMTALKVDGSAVTQPVSGTVAVTGVATAANQTTLIGHVDGVETLIGTTNTTLSTIDGRVDTLESLIGTTNSTLTTIDGRVDGVEGLLTTVAGAVKAEDAAHTTADAGIMALAVRADTAAATGANGDYVPLIVDSTGRLHANVSALPRAATVVDVSLASDTTSAQLLAANANRIGLTLTNTDANAVYVYFGTTAVATKFTVKIPADGYYEMPQPIYTGRIDALWAGNGSGSLIGTELAA